ncbi:hypothetical protein COU91_02490 [Candidatus Saccharibacteria bacterium CG10_big_fil_rev_8_21_14_0_10_47_8]|nr:MAG: hypothetical protein COU91_02490 [Candidatus Saccharibacteria bacterium CG10_big_fil_rev_8_21_14_0_10_47_8]
MVCHITITLLQFWEVLSRIKQKLIHLSKISKRNFGGQENKKGDDMSIKVVTVDSRPQTISVRVAA